MRPQLNAISRREHRACFNCRKIFNQRSRQDVAVCPHYASPLYEVGAYFKAPKKTDVKQWEKIKLLHQAGYRFESYRGSNVMPLFPERSKDVSAFIEQHKRNLEQRNRQQMMSDKKHYLTLRRRQHRWELEGKNLTRQANTKTNRYSAVEKS